MTRLFVSAAISACMLSTASIAQQAAPTTVADCDNPANAASSQCVSFSSANVGSVNFAQFGGPIAAGVIGIGIIAAIAGNDDGGSTPSTTD
ncbi:MAG: hypothetical protein CSA72_12240 [Rhodobacterales bacterium]|nr:MAG: hypothetical protein CSA72_12240 [Rhodobacterales bacterium]